MIHITIGDLILAINDLFENKMPLIQDLLAFQLYGGPLQEKRDVLDSIYRRIPGTPLAQSLLDKEQEHDNAARGLYFICETFSQMHTPEQETREFWLEIRQIFIPSRAILKASYADKAVAAHERIKKLPERRAELEAIAVPNDMTLYSLISKYLEAGVALGSLLSSRADEEVAEEAKRTKRLHMVRSETLGVLGMFRKTLAQEVVNDESLPRNLEAQVFYYLEQLAESRDAHNATREDSDEEREENNGTNDEISSTVPVSASLPITAVS